MRPQNRYKKKLKALGLCVNCGKPKSPTSVYCGRCVIDHRTRQIILAKERAKAGRCIRCEKPTKKTNKRYCEFHGKKDSERMMRYYYKNADKLNATARAKRRAQKNEKTI